MSQRLRPRYRRISALLLSAGLTVFAMLCGLGLFGTASTGASAYTATSKHIPALATSPEAPRTGNANRAAEATQARAAARLDSDVALPADSGKGRRVVFDMSAQRVWLVADDDTVERSYLVSGSLTDNLDPGRYAVYSRSRHAIGVEDSGTMQYFVRFTHGDNAAIGFHDIPVKDGRPLQTKAELGTPQSHGCIRQARPDAIRLWRFAPVGTHVDVVA